MRHACPRSKYESEREGESRAVITGLGPCPHTGGGGEGTSSMNRTEVVKDALSSELRATSDSFRSTGWGGQTASLDKRKKAVDFYVPLADIQESTRWS